MNFGGGLIMSSTKSRQLTAFMQVSLDGYFCDAYGDMSFAPHEVWVRRQGERLGVAAHVTRN
jgi:hypothetical protein